MSVLFILQKFIDREHNKSMIELRANNQKITLPMKLQAYERLSLFIERISLNNLVMRVHKQGMSARLFQSELLKTIRAEYEHNLAQQIYVSNTVWDAVKTSKEETIKAINIASSKVRDDSSGLDLCNVILELITKIEKLPTDITLDIIKSEVRQIL